MNNEDQTEERYSPYKTKAYMWIVNLLAFSCAVFFYYTENFYAQIFITLFATLTTIISVIILVLSNAITLMSFDIDKQKIDSSSSKLINSANRTSVIFIMNSAVCMASLITVYGAFAHMSLAAILLMTIITMIMVFLKELKLNDIENTRKKDENDDNK